MEAIKLSAKQRRFLKAQSHHLKPLIQLGKEGPSAGFLRQLEEQINAHELIKVKVLGNCLAEKEEIEAAVAGVGVVVVQKIGHIYTFFRQRAENSNFELD